MSKVIRPGGVILVAGMVLFTAALSAAGTRDFAVEVSATAYESPPRIDFSWPVDLSATEYRIFKKSVEDTVWTGPIAVLGGGATSFTDSDVAVGGAYEYSFQKAQCVISDTLSVTSGTAVTFTIWYGRSTQVGILPGDIRFSGTVKMRTTAKSQAVSISYLSIPIGPDSRARWSGWSDTGRQQCMLS